MRLTGRCLLLMALQGMAACGGSSTAPTSVPAPTITSISPGVGSVAGLTRIDITGTGLRLANVTLSGAPTTGVYDPSYADGTHLSFFTQSHAAGTVDVVVTNPDGQSARLNAAYTFVLPQSFDFNGRWSGFGNNGQDYEITFTIQNNLLLTASCVGFPGYPGATLTFSPPVPATNGEFSFVGDGVKFSGWMIEASLSTGGIRLGPCASDAWTANKQ